MTRKNQGYTFRYTTSQNRMARILAALEKPMSRDEIAEAVGCSIRAVQSYLHALLAEEPKRIRIVDWRTNYPGSPSAVYQAGAGRSKSRPKAMTASERSKKRWKDPEFAIDEIRKGRMKRMNPQRDPLAAALFGAA